MAMMSRRPGEWITLDVERAGSRLELQAQLGARPREITPQRFHAADRIDVSERRDDLPLAVRHDALIEPEECGGVLLGATGDVLGLNVARADRTGTLAIPGSTIRKIVSKLRLADRREF